VINNTNPEMRPVNIEITGNRVAGSKFGALFMIGSGHRIIDNIFEGLNMAHCDENAARFGCIFRTKEPAMLESGIYLSRNGTRPAETSDNVVIGNRISGYKMRERCIAMGPAVGENKIVRNACSNSRFQEVSRVP